jgi:enoyl-CoA hydratase/carnithine racemase
VSYGTLQIEQVGATRLIRLNRPERLNAYTPEMGEDLVAAFRGAAGDDMVRAIVVTGEGRAFCAGADRDWLAGARGPSGLALGEEAFVRDFALELAALPKLTIAAFNGAAAGVGITMSLNFDLRLAAAGTLFRLNFAELGILPGMGASHHLPRLIGVAAAKRLLLCERRLLAEPACALGLVDEVCAPDELLPRALACAELAAQCAPAMIAGIKELMNAGTDGSLADALRREQRLAALVPRPSATG